MNTTNYIRIFRGDDSDALGYQTIVGTIKTDVDLAGCKAVFRFLGFYAEFDPIPEDKKLTIVIPAQASRGFPPGVGYASLKVVDALGKIRTFTNRIPVIVDTMTPSCSGGEFEISFSPFPNLEPLRIFMGPNADDFDQYTGFISKTIDRASLVKYGLVMLADAMGEDGGASGKAASPLAVKAAYDAIIKELVDNYYTAEQTEEAIDRVAAYYITYTAAGAAFPTYSALSNATTVYSGGKVRIPTRNDYCVVLADETHGGAEYRYIYAVAEGETTGSWQPQFPVEGVMTVDQTVQKNSQNPVSGGGVWSAIWGALSALPTDFSSLYDWCVTQLAGKASKSDATLTPVYSQAPTFSEWTYSGIPDGWIVETPPRIVTDPEILQYYNWMMIFFDGEVSRPLYSTSAIDSDEVVFENNGDSVITATRVRTDIIGYTLGSQSDKPLQPKGDYPTKAQLDAGWWSEWTVSPAAPTGKHFVIEFDGIENWNVWLLNSDESADDYPPDWDGHPYTGEEDALAFSVGGTNYTATRHRVAAPVPTKPGDIGAAPATNIAKSALASEVQTSLGKADTAVQPATLNSYAPLASPAFTGTPTAPTPTSGDNSTKVATTAFVQAAVEGATPNLDYVMRVDPETGGIYYTTPNTNA